ncbi:hypothetical protein T10_10873 [Trichinella papuae]|uniref:Uncharacterized protein n=1 Tax=Trichinella papuae TaxID=268474 RepID=A0A0V1MLB9_9BILA|nr:hypothetical protein T10_10873 [Trichinella papuae]
MAIEQSYFGKNTLMSFCLSLLPFPSLTRVSLCMVLRTKTFLFFFGTYDTMVQSSEKANLEEFNFLPCRCSSSHGSSGLFLLPYQPNSTPSEYEVKTLSHVTLSPFRPFAMSRTTRMPWFSLFHLCLLLTAGMMSLSPLIQSFSLLCTEGIAGDWQHVSEERYPLKFCQTPSKTFSYAATFVRSTLDFCLSK